MKKQQNNMTPDEKHDSDLTGKLDRREFLVKAGKGTFVISMWPILSRCADDEELNNSKGNNENVNPTGVDSNEDKPKSKFYFAVLSDTHIVTDDDATQNQIMAMTVDLLNNHNPPIDLVLVAGDCVDSLPSDEYDFYFKNETELDYLARFKSDLDMPLYLSMGNHDYYTVSNLLERIPEQDQKLAVRETVFSEKLGLPAPYFSAEHMGVKFYCLNSMQQDPAVDWRPEMVGCFGPSQLAWLKDELSDDKPAFFAHHHALATEQSITAGYSGLFGIPWEVPRADAHFEKYENWKKLYNGILGGLMEKLGFGDFDYTDPIYRLLDDHNHQVKGIFCGHTHVFLRDSYAGIPMFMGDSMKNPRYFTYDNKDTMRYQIIECEEDTGNFSVYNEHMIEYIDEQKKAQRIANGLDDQGQLEFIKFLERRGFNRKMIEALSAGE